MELYLCGLLCCLTILLISFLSYIDKMFGVMDVVPKLYYKESDLTKYLLTYSKSLKVSFRPKRFITHCYIQTLMGYFKPPIKDITFTREYVQMDDRGIIALDWHKDSKIKIRKGCSIFIIFPRLTGDALSVSQTCVMAAKKGFRTVVFNRRGHGSSYLTTPKLTNPGDPSDVKQVLEYISLKYPCANIAGVGIGAGCALVLESMVRLLCSKLQPVFYPPMIIRQLFQIAFRNFTNFYYYLVSKR